MVISRSCLVEGKEMFKDLFNARAQLLFCSLNLLFGDVLVAVAVAVVFCVRSLLSFLARAFKCFLSSDHEAVV